MGSISPSYVQTLSSYDKATSLGFGHEERSTSGRSSDSLVCRYSVCRSLSATDVNRLHILCAEPGMGKTALLSRALEERSKRGETTRFEDCRALECEALRARIAEVLRWARKMREKGREAAIALDNVCIEDEHDAEQISRLLRHMASTGCSIMVSMLPESEELAELLGEAVVYWSCNLRLQENDATPTVLALDEVTHGIPLLAGVCERAGIIDGNAAQRDPGYLQAYISVVKGSLRRSLMDEELKLRCVLLMLGCGTFMDAETCVEDVEPDVWRLLARDAPLYGIDATKETFCCVGGGSSDGLAPIFSSLCATMAPWPDVVLQVARRLVARGMYGRAATVSLMCSSKSLRHDMALRWAAEFIDAGELGIVEDTLQEVWEEAGELSRRAAQASCLIWALTKPVAYLQKKLSQLPEGLLGDGARLCVASRGMLNVLSWDEGWKDLIHDASAGLLLLHTRAVWLMADGRMGEAFSLLLDVPQRLGEPSVLMALLEMDFVLCSILMGVAPSSVDLEAFDRAGFLLERMGLRSLSGVHDAILPLGALASGRKSPHTSFEAHVHRASNMGDTLLYGVFLLASSVYDIRNRAFVRAHVRLERARAEFKVAKATYLVKVVHLLDICVRIQLSERVTRSEIGSCRGESKPLGKVVTVLLAALSAKRGNRPVGSGRWDLSDVPRDAHWVMNIILGDFGQLSTKVRNVMPPVWLKAVEKSASEIDSMEDGVPGPAMPAVAGGVQMLAPREDARPVVEEPTTRVQINMLGGFEVKADNILVVNSTLERRRAKSMLALLAAVPGHVAKRFTIMESIWPEYDYETANRCVYSATSVIRSEICSILGDVRGASIVTSNKSERTVSLNPTVVTVDVDLFEERARRVLDSEGEDQLIVELCREIEDLYRGGLFVPSTDGAGIVTVRAKELCDLYCDAMIAGYEAALNCEMKILACRFAKKAHEANDIREDAVHALLTALCAAGRQVEAEQVYERYVGHVVDVTRRPPSRGLRQAISEFSLGAESGHASGKRGRKAKLEQRGAEVIEIRLPSQGEQLSLNLDEGYLGDLAVS